jgi:hypothetical protein
MLGKLVSTLAGCKHISGEKNAEDNLITMLDEVGLRLNSFSVLVTTKPTMNSMGRILERDNVLS